MKTYAQEQLDAMKNYEINLAVAEKLGYYTGVASGKCSISIHPFRESGSTARFFNPYEVPNDYMPIVIEHHISIDFDVNRNVCAVFTINYSDDYKTSDFVASRDLPKDQIGRAVCECFLMMETEQ